MPVNVEYLKKHGDDLKGSQGKLSPREFISLRRKGIVKRISPWIKPIAKKENLVNKKSK